jgi:putative AdoMet-dependent methyltransferase
LGDERRLLFDKWAESYDESVKESSGFPHEGYERVLDLVAARARVEPGMEVLDLGIGTGNLAARLLDLGCRVWGLDFSLKMLARAHAKFPQIELIKADLGGDWPIDVDHRFDRVVSAYVLHEFDLESKVRLLCKLVRDHVFEGGRVVVGDVSFLTRVARDEAPERYGKRRDEETGEERIIWDEEEFYWAADEASDALGEHGLRVSYEQVSFCGGVYVIEREVDAMAGEGV